MPRRKQYNNNARAFISRHEKEEAGFGTRKVRFGADSLKPFHHCSLCLETVVNPVASPEGHMFCKECIFCNLVAQKEDIARKLLQWEMYCKECELRKEQKLQEKTSTLVRKLDGHSAPVSAAPVFEHKDFVAPAGPSSTDLMEQRILETEDLKERHKAAVEKVKSKNLAPDRDQVRQIVQKSFWVPQSVPEEEEHVDKPETFTKCPISGRRLKAKHLITLNLDPVAAESASGGKYQCPCCRKTLGHQKVILYRKCVRRCTFVTLPRCGHVLCSVCNEKFVLKQKDLPRCYVCAAPLKKKDFIGLKEGGTSYAAHNTVEAKRYAPALG